MPFEIISQNDKNLSHPTIAIIDDEFTSRIILDKIVRGLQKDIFVQAFASPLGAIDWLRLNQPDLILVDYLMDEMSGLEVIKTIRRIPHLEHVPIIMITVSNDNEIRHRHWIWALPNFSPSHSITTNARSAAAICSLCTGTIKKCCSVPKSLKKPLPRLRGGYGNANRKH